MTTLFELFRKKSKFLGLRKLNVLVVQAIIVASLIGGMGASALDSSKSLRVAEERVVEIEQALGFELEGQILLPMGESFSQEVPWREVAKANVFVDGYFPFLESAVIEWSSRYRRAASLELCFQSGESACLNHLRSFADELRIILIDRKIAPACARFEEVTAVRCIEMGIQTAIVFP